MISQALFRKSKISRLVQFSLFTASVSVPFTVTAEDIVDPLTSLNEQYWWIADGWANGHPFLNAWDARTVTYSSSGLDITLRPKGLPTTPLLSGEVRTHGFYGYGCFEVEMKPIKAPGVVTSFFLFSGPFDKPEDGNGIHNEIDVEFLGSNTNMVQFNFWTDDDAYENSHESIVFLPFDASQEFHKYSIYWGPEGIDWYIDDILKLKVKNNPFDPTPSIESSRLRVMKNVWAVDKDLANWAGRFKERGKKSYTAQYRNFKFSASKKCNE